MPEEKITIEITREQLETIREALIKAKISYTSMADYPVPLSSGARNSYGAKARSADELYNQLSRF